MRVHAHVRSDKLEIIETDKFQKFLKNLVGNLITIDLEKVRTQRTIPENRYLHGVVFPILADYFGYDIRIPEELEALKQIVYSVHLKKKVRLSRDRRRKITITRRASDLDTKEFEILMEDIRIWAKLEFNVTIPPPDKDYRNN